MCPVDDDDVWMEFKRLVEPIESMNDKESKEVMTVRYFNALEVLFRITGGQQSN